MSDAVADVPTAAGNAFRILVFSSPAAFLERAGTFLLAAEAEHSLILGVAGSLAADGDAVTDALFFAVEQDARVVGCAFRTPPEKLALTRLPLPAVPALVAAVGAHYAVLPGLLATGAAGAAFAAAWAAQHAVRATARMRQGIYELTRVTDPARPAPGTLRRAEPRDVEWLAGWVAGFARDADHPLADPAGVARSRVERGLFWLWEDGAPVCLAGRMGRTPHGDRIGFVYTPPEHRGRGYASVLVARLSRQVLAEGLRFCSLYTDLGNATSNAIYRRLGYTMIAESADYVFEPLA